MMWITTFVTCVNLVGLRGRRLAHLHDFEKTGWFAVHAILILVLLDKPPQRHTASAHSSFVHLAVSGSNAAIRVLF